MKEKNKKLFLLLGINIILLLINIIFISDIPLSASCATQFAEVTPAESENQIKKKIALTFDDGPHEKYTPMLLDGLKERNVSASFFLMGKNAEKYPEIVERMKEEGHVVGNHSYSHVQLNSMKEVEACKEMTKANEVIRKITGETPNYVRPPFGAWSNNLDCITNMIVVLWDVDTLVTRV
ncbi:MAG: polysaccharide deacetylase family protein [Lachnospiraceae bacterium]|nr:polysaccharide deacetylase family protein [Lachnospiraceae bacterium]